MELYLLMLLPPLLWWELMITSGSARGVYVSGKYAYVTDETAGLQIIDISTPSSPSLVGNMIQVALLEEFMSLVSMLMWRIQAQVFRLLISPLSPHLLCGNL
jgi:hypothetical protein